VQESAQMGERIAKWNVDYGDGEVHEITVPHVWRQDVDVRFEGPVRYWTTLDVPREPSVLWFEGVSYEGLVSIDGRPILTHTGIWDSFEAPLTEWSGKQVEVEVLVTKNGGARYPVRDVASGFLPYVYHTFGGIWGKVEVRSQDKEAPIPTSRIKVEGSMLLLDWKPFYLRGVLHWGWYPSVGSHNAPDETIRKEVQEAKRLGFNLMKFCLWVPPHRYLEILREEGMEAWLELPIWDPSPEPAKLEAMGQEIERIVRQYRRHDNIVVWTIGCELSHATPPEFRQHMVQLVKNLTGCPLVKDNSGGAEMYGGDLREYGDFYDFHPYCDAHYYPTVLDSLLPGPRGKVPILLGEFNDVDTHRDLAHLNDEMPFWASKMPELNDQGVRWQHDLPTYVSENPMAIGEQPERHRRLMESARSKALFVRKYVNEAVRARAEIGGYVITGMRDTPISSAGMFDDWGNPRFTAEECLLWNGSDALFLIPSRRPPWVNGGNRPGWRDPYNQFVGQVFFKVGVHSESGINGGLNWRILNSDGDVVHKGAEASLAIVPLESSLAAQISWKCNVPGSYHLEADFGPATNAWNFHVEAMPDFADWKMDDRRGLAGHDNASEGRTAVQFGDPTSIEPGAVYVLDQIGTQPAPFWRESAYEFSADAPFHDQWERLLGVSGDRVLDMEVLGSLLPAGARTETIINRVDVRTYQEAPVLIKVIGDNGVAVITTLRPHGGMGIQPFGLNRNAAGCALLRHLTSWIQ
jgi:hypothetical protein